MSLRDFFRKLNPASKSSGGVVPHHQGEIPDNPAKQPLTVTAPRGGGRISLDLKAMDLDPGLRREIESGLHKVELLESHPLPATDDTEDLIVIYRILLDGQERAEFEVRYSAKPPEDAEV